MKESSCSLYSILRQKNISEDKGIAVAVNNVVVPYSNWNTFIVKENAKVLVITASQGG